jgi:serine-type D-Ala-D-Ala carboxypeptidase/endopeptidase
MNARSACLLLLGITLTNPARASADDFTDAVQSLASNYVTLDHKCAGIVIGLVDAHGSRIITCGKSDNPKSPELNGDTVFEIGSITKVFTTLLLQDMVDRGKMKMDDPVSKYLPTSVKMPERSGKEITLLHLATHTSGLPRDVDNFDNTTNSYADYTPERLYEFLTRYQLTRDPGEKWEYSNLGMGLLGYVIARKAGSDYETLVRHRICRPLKLDSTCITLTPDLKARLAQGHTTSGEPSVNMEFQTLIGNGALRSTANDMLRFLSANCGLINSGLQLAMERTRFLHIEGQALGWGEDNSGNFWKNGGTYGYRCDAGFNPDKRRAVIVLSNTTGQDDEIDEIAYMLIQAEWRADRRPKAVTIDPHTCNAYAGDYKLGDTVYHVSGKDNRLLIQTKGHLTGELLPKSERMFFARISGKEVTFTLDAQGKVTQMNLAGADKPLVAVKL